MVCGEEELMNETRVQADRLNAFFTTVLHRSGVRADVAKSLVEGVLQASLRGVDSHGIRLFPHYLQGLEAGRLNKNPQYRFTDSAAGTARLDADHAPGHAAGAEGMRKAMALAERSGIGATAVCNSSHFGAAAYYALMAADSGMIGMSFTHATAHVFPHGGARPFLGNNPVCLAAPCEGEEPFCLDMATTVATFNKVQQKRGQGAKVPIGWGVDAEGRDTDDPARIEGLLPVGGYKGFGLSMMLEILCALLTGAPFGPHVSHMFGVPMEEKRRLGHFFIALRIDCFEDPFVFRKRLKAMIDQLRSEPRRDADFPLLAPGDPEKAFWRERSQAGIPVDEGLLAQLSDLAGRYQVALDLGGKGE